MPSVEALILPAASRAANAVLGGLRLAERAARALHRGGIDRVLIAPSCEIDQTTIAKLARRGIAVSRAAETPLASVTPGQGLLVVSGDVVFEPAAVRALLERLDGRQWSGAAAADPAPGTFAALTPEAVDRLRDVAESHLHDALGELRVCELGPVFCRWLSHRREAPVLEREYIKHRNGEEGVFTRTIRMFSVPTTQLLLRLRLTANAVTLLGLALAAAAALTFSRRAYGPGIAGALIYYASMVLDCSDGEVARATLSDSRFGAWLETWTDYLSYFLVLGGLVWGELRAHPVCHHLSAAAIAAATSLVIVAVVGYLRGRVAGINPGAFDDALAGELRRGSRFQRSAVWARQLIKRSFLAHLILFQALIGHLPALLYVWAYGSLGALAVLLAVQSSLVRRVKVVPIRIPATFGAVEE